MNYKCTWNFNQELHGPLYAVAYAQVGLNILVRCNYIVQREGLKTTHIFLKVWSTAVKY